MSNSTEIQREYHDLVRQDVFEFLPEKMGRVLDLGGGIGATSAAIKEMGRADRIVVVDLVGDNALPSVDRAFGGDLEDPSFLAHVIAEEGPFDSVLCLDVLEHLREPWSVVEQLRDGLSPDGVMMTSLPNVRHVRLLWPLVAHGRFQLANKGIMDRTHLRWFTHQSAIELMTPEGLKLEVIHGKIPLNKWYRRANMVTFGLFRRFLEIQYLIRVRKAV